MQPALSKLEAEQAEVDVVLSSGVLGRTNNLVRLLSFVCEKYFAGSASEIKEYSIAVHALGRPESFDPQIDTIVRVSAHALRKRLEEYYRGAGADHPVQICLPAGHYVPKFIHKQEGPFHLGLRVVGAQTSQPANGGPSYGSDSSSLEQRNLPSVSASEVQVAPTGPSDNPSTRRFRSSLGNLKLALIILLSAAAALIFAWRRSDRISAEEGAAAKPLVEHVRLGLAGQALHAMAASNISPYVDRNGATWESDNYCSGGSSFSVTGHSIIGTDDPLLFLSGRRGAFACRYPVAPGTYEIHLMFAETGGLQENSRNVGFSINGGPALSLDVVDDAGGDDIATAKIITDVSPESDGTIHLDFNAPEGFLNAVEILPGLAHRMLPVRIITGHTAYKDSAGNDWQSDRYFFGGRLSNIAGDLSKLRDGRLYEWHRFGHFHYVVPVTSGAKYTLKLHFMEHWFGVQNGGIGGAGSRVFDVSCNGVMLLKGFDIFREAGTLPLVKTFTHIEPTPQGKIEIYFTPSVNYPSISAIEVIPE
jgi:hypothetical protein